jgi:hypothetical protein
MDFYSSRYIQVGMIEGQNWQNARLVFESCDFHALFSSFFLVIYGYKGMAVRFLIPLETLYFDLYNSNST